MLVRAALPALGLLVATGCSTPAGPPPSPRVADPIAQPLTSYGGTETSGALAPDGQRFAFVSAHAGTPDIWIRDVSGGEPTRLTNDAATESDLVYAPDGRSVYYTRVSSDGTSIWRLGVDGGDPRRVVGGAETPGVSPDGQRLSWFRRRLDDTASLSISATDGSTPQMLVADVFSATGLTRADWSPDGRRLAYTSGTVGGAHNLYLVDVETRERTQVTRFSRSLEGTEAQAWLPDGRHLVVVYRPAPRAGAAADLGIADTTAEEITPLSVNAGASLGAPSLSSDGTRMLLASRREAHEVWRVPQDRDPLGNGLAAARVVDATHDPAWIFVSRDGSTLLFNNALAGGRNIWTMPVDGNTPPRQITRVAGNTVTQAALSPDGSHVAFVSSTTGFPDIWVQHVDGSGLRQLTRDLAADGWPVWSPDGRRIAFASFTANAWETRTVPAGGGPAEKLMDGLFRGDWAPKRDGTGTLIATANASGGIRLLDVEQRTIVWEDRRDETDGATPVFSPDGRWISVVHREPRERVAIWVYDVATGASRAVARFARPFALDGRAGWIEQGQAFLVGRTVPSTHLVLFNRFWTGPQTPAP